MTTDENTSKTDEENPYLSPEELIGIDDEDTEDPLEQGISSDDLPEGVMLLQNGDVLKDGEGVIGRVDPENPSLEELPIDD